MKCVGSAVVVALAVCASCFPDLSVDPGAQIECDFDEECPTGELCQPAQRLCVDKGAIDKTPAGFVVPPVVDPPSGGATTAFTVTFDVSEALVADPLVVLDRGDNDVVPLSADAGATDRNALHYVFDYQSDGGEVEGARPVAFTLIDLGGNLITIKDAASLVFDFEPPQLAGPSTLSANANAVGVGDEVTLSFVMGEALPAPPVVDMSGPSGTVAWDAAAQDAGFPLFFTFTFTRDADLAAGNYDVHVHATDAAGNAMNADAGVLVAD